jgi:hypothetical protein
MFSPARWPDGNAARAKVRDQLIAALKLQFPQQLGRPNPNRDLFLNQVEVELANELPFLPNAKFSGITTD